MKAVLLTVLIASGVSLDSFGRTWTSTDGKTLEGDFVRAEGASVILKIGGREVTVPSTRLSQVDRDWIAAQAPLKPEQASDLLSRSLRADLSPVEVEKLVEYFRTLFPEKGLVKKAEYTWNIRFQRLSTSSRIIANFHQKPSPVVEDVSIEFVFTERAEEPLPDKLGEFTSVRKGYQTVVRVGRVTVSATGRSPSYLEQAEMEQFLNMFDFAAISKL